MARQARRYCPRMGPNRFRRFAAIVAAYALVLQALVAAFAVPGGLALAAADPSVICRSNAGGSDPASPAAHDLCVACLAGHCASSFAGGDAAATLLRWPADAIAVALPAVPHAPVTLARHHQHAPRAPPLG